MKEVLKKTINIIGYILILLIPLLVLMYMTMHTTVQIICCIMFIIIFIFQVIHIRKSKIKFIGIRIMITLLLITILTTIVHYSYGAIKTKQGKELLKNIEKIEYENYTIEKEELEHAEIEFINEKTVFSKVIYDAKIYYKDGTIENTIIKYGGTSIYTIKGLEYYIKIPSLY